MSPNSNDNIVLVAPRPVRLASGFSSFSSRAGAAAFRVLSTTPSLEHLKLVDDSQDNNPQSDQISPRASPRASLQSEALEEFLSILRLYPPTSPVLRATVRRNGTMSVVPYERPHPYKRDTSESGKTSHTPSPSRSRTGVCVTPFKSWSPEGNVEIGDEPSVWYPFEWRTYDVHNSPVNRAQARNPFHRQASYDPDTLAGQVISHMRSDSLATPSPLISPSMVALSPAAVPLPSPGPEEGMELDFM